MYEYDVLRDTWIYAEIRQQIQAGECEERLAEQRQMLLEIVQARFPRLEPLAKEAAEHVTDPALMRTLIVKVSIARIEKEARQGFAMISGDKKNC